MEAESLLWNMSSLVGVWVHIRTKSEQTYSLTEKITKAAFFTCMNIWTYCTHEAATFHCGLSKSDFTYKQIFPHVEGKRSTQANFASKVSFFFPPAILEIASRQAKATKQAAIYTFFVCIRLALGADAGGRRRRQSHKKVDLNICLGFPSYVGKQSMCVSEKGGEKTWRRARW